MDGIKLMLLVMVAAMVCMASAQQCPDTKEEMMAVVRQCMRNTSSVEGGGRDREVRSPRRERQGGQRGFEGPRPDPACVVQCVMQTMGLFNEDGTLNREGTMTHLQDCERKHERMSRYFQNAQECVNQHGDSMRSSSDCSSLQDFVGCLLPRRHPPRRPGPGGGNNVPDYSEVETL